MILNFQTNQPVIVSKNRHKGKAFAFKYLNKYQKNCYITLFSQP